MLPNSARRIELDDLVRQEVQAVLDTISDPSFLNTRIGGTLDQQVRSLATVSTQLLDAARPFCASLQVAARYGTPESLAPWASGIRDLIRAAVSRPNLAPGLTELRHLPNTLALMTGAIAATATPNWAALNVLYVENTVRWPAGNALVIEMTNPHLPFDNDGHTPTVLANAAAKNQSFEDAAADYVADPRTRRRTPAADWVHTALRPFFEDQLVDETSYSEAFDRAEVMLGILATDASRPAADGGTGRRGRVWFGRSIWRAAYGHGNPVEEFSDELRRYQSAWGPLRDGLFGGSVNRAQAAITTYSQAFHQRVEAVL